MALYNSHYYRVPSSFIQSQPKDLWQLLNSCTLQSWIMRFGSSFLLNIKLSFKKKKTCFWVQPLTLTLLDSILRTHLFEGFLIWRHWKVIPAVKSSITPGGKIVAWFVICYFPCCGDCLAVPGRSLRPSLIGPYCLSKPQPTLRTAFVGADKWVWPLTIK